MRKIGILKEGEAETVANYLYSQEIEVELRQETDNKVGIWVIEETDQEQAKEIITQFQENPHDPRFRKPSILSRKRAVSRDAGARKRNLYVDVRTQIFARGGIWRSKLIATTIIFCIVIYMLYATKQALPFLDLLFYHLPAITEGQVWRLLTPIFLHFSFFHLLFNMWWLYDLGNKIEQEESTKRLLLMVIVIGVVSNTGQYIVSGPLFGGFSGVVYGLLGYIWMLAKYAPRPRYEIDKFILTLMIIWLILGVTGVLGNIANTAHVVGLVVGTVWGLIASGQLKFPRRK